MFKNIINEDDNQYILNIFPLPNEQGGVNFFYSNINNDIEIVIKLINNEEIEMFFLFDCYKVKIPIIYEINIKTELEKRDLEKRGNEIIKIFFSNIDNINLIKFDSEDIKLFIKNLGDNFTSDDLNSILGKELISILSRINEINEIKKLNIQKQALLYSKGKDIIISYL